MYFEDYEEVMYNFLRSRVEEVTRVGLSNRMTSDSQSFTGDNSTVEFTLTQQPQSIVNVTVNGVEQVMYSAYNIDLDNKKIKFRVAPATDADIVVNFKRGSNWIYPDSPKSSLTKNSYPRIGIFQITAPEQPEEMGNQVNSYATVTFQIDVVTYLDQECTIGSETYTGVDVAKYIGRQVRNAFKDYAKTDLIYCVWDFAILNNYPQPFEDSLNTHRRIIEVSLEFRNMRRMVT